MQRFHQLGYVTSALDRAWRTVADLHSVEHFRERERTIACERFGVRGTAVLRVAVANMPGVQIELIQPITGQIEVFADALAGDGFVLRPHHVAYRIEGSAADWQRHLHQLRDDDRRIAWQGTPSPDGAFAYTDDRDSLGHLVERFWSTPERWAAMMQSVPSN